jgi:hypothetical protein
MAWPLATDIELLSEQQRIPIVISGSWVKDGKRFSITQADLDAILNNFQRSKKREVVCDFEHASEQPGVAQGKAVPAAGWIAALDKTGGTLFATVDWNDDTADLIRSKKYKYVSPAIDFGATDKETGDPIGARLTSLALTNHPFLEELPALMLSDVSLAEGEKNDKIIHVPIPQGDGDFKVKVKVQKKDSDNEGKELSEEQRLCDETSDGFGEVQLDDKTDATHAKVGSGDSVSRSDFAYVGDPEKKSTWKFPIHDASHVRNALARWGQSKGIPADDKPSVLHKILRRAKSLGVKFDKDNPKYKIAASDALDYSLSELFASLFPEQSKEPKTETKTMKASDLRTTPKKILLVEDDRFFFQAGDKFYTRGYTRDGDTITLSDDVDLAEKGVVEDMEKRAQGMSDKDGVKDDKDMQKELRKEAEKQGKDRGAADEDEEEAILAELAEHGSLRMKMMKGADGKPRGHMITDKSGKRLGFVSHDAFMRHAAPFRKTDTEASGTGKKEVNTRLSEAIEDLTGKAITLSDVVHSVQFATEHEQEVIQTRARQESIKLVLSECFPDNAGFSSKTFDRLWADDKISKKDYFGFKWSIEEVNKAINSGQFVPRARQVLTELALTNHDAFVKLCKMQPKTIDYESRGVAGTGMELGLRNADQELNERIQQARKDDPKLDAAAAMKKVLMTDADLAKRYHNEHVNNVQ